MPDQIKILADEIIATYTELENVLGRNIYLQILEEDGDGNLLARVKLDIEGMKNLHGFLGELLGKEKCPPAKNIQPELESDVVCFPEDIEKIEFTSSKARFEEALKKGGKLIFSPELMFHRPQVFAVGYCARR